MRDQLILDIQEAYQQIYNKQVGLQLDESVDYDIFDDIVEFCEDIQIFDSIGESEYFADLIIQEGLTQTFIEDVLEYCSQAQLLDEEYITEISGGLLRRGLKIAGGLLKKPSREIVGLPAKTLTKKGFIPTGFSSKGGRLSGAARIDDIERTQAARAARRPPEPEKANKFADLLKQKQSSATKPKTSLKNVIDKGWERHNVAKGTETALATLLGPALFMGLKGAAAPTTKALTNVATNAPISRLLPSTVKSSPTSVKNAAQKTFNYVRRSFTGGPKTRLAEPGGALVTTKGPRPSVKPEALPKPPKGTEPGGKLTRLQGQSGPEQSSSAIVRRTGGSFEKPAQIQKVQVRDITPQSLPSSKEILSKPSFKPEALPKPPKGTEPGGKLTRLQGQSGPEQSSSAIARRSGSSLEKPTQIQRVQVKDATAASLPSAKTISSKPSFNRDLLPKPPKTAEVGGPLVTTKSPKPSNAPMSPGEVQRNILPASPKPKSKSSKKDSRKSSGSTLKRTPSDAGLPFRAIGTGIAAGGAALVGQSEDERRKRDQNVIPRYNTKDPSGRVRSRLKVGPKIVGPRTVGSTFDDAFREARRQGKKTFRYGDKEFTTKMAEEFFIDYLISEGFASDVRSAQGIMDVMSEEWIQSVIVS